jgi:hypothetical protein
MNAAARKEAIELARRIARNKSHGYGSPFERIALALERDDLEAARAIYREIPKAGMGGFLDSLDGDMWNVVVPRFMELFDA